MPLADLHCDTLHRLRYGEVSGDMKQNDGQVDLERLTRMGSLLQVFAAFVETRCVEDPLEACMLLVEDFHHALKAAGLEASLVRTAGDLTPDRLNLLLSVEEGAVLGTSLETLDLLYGQGVRAITLTWNYPNALGYPNHEFVHSDQGLTPFGKQVVEAMVDKGVAVDVSHLSDAGFRDVAGIVKGPFMASHSGARSMHHHSRNLTDDQIRILGESGGVIGVTMVPWFLDGTQEMTVEKWVRHVRHIHNVGGAEVLAFGSDFDGMQGTFEVDGVQDTSLLTAALRRSGLSESAVEGFSSRNAFRFFKGVLKGV